MPLCPISIVNSKTEIISSRSLSSSPRFSSSYLLLQKMFLFLLFHSFLFLFVFSLVLFIMMITNMIIIIIIPIIIIAMIIQTAAVRFSLLGCHPPLVLSLFSLLYTNIYIFLPKKEKKRTNPDMFSPGFIHWWICCSSVFLLLFLFSITSSYKIDEFEPIATNTRPMLEVWEVQQLNWESPSINVNALLIVHHFLHMLYRPVLQLYLSLSCWNTRQTTKIFSSSINVFRTNFNLI